MGRFYHYNGYKLVGHCKNGIVYDDNYRSIGTYEKGRVYDDNYTFKGTYEKGRVYDDNYTLMGTYEKGACYDSYYNHVCTYEDDGAEAAAYLLLKPGHANISDSDLSDERSGPAAGVAIVLLGGFLLLMAPVSLLAIWWAIFEATGPTDMPFLITFLLSILLGIFLGITACKASNWPKLYMYTVFIASVVCIVVSFFTSPGYSIFLILLIPPIVVALASVVPTAIVFYSVRVIRFGIAKARQRRG